MIGGGVVVGAGGVVATGGVVALDDAVGSGGVTVTAPASRSHAVGTVSTPSDRRPALHASIDVAASTSAAERAKVDVVATGASARWTDRSRRGRGRGPVFLRAYIQGAKRPPTTHLTGAPPGS